jgi:LPS-assembly lipoprotein
MWWSDDMICRRSLLGSAAALALSACGFELRRAPSFAFKTLFTSWADSSGLGNEFKRAIAANGDVRVVTDVRQLESADVLLDILQDQREKIVVGVNSSGGVREFQLRLRCKFRLRAKNGKELIPETEILQQRDISFNESAVLSKEAEESLLYRNMQSDIVQQLMRRLAAVSSL